MDKATLKEVLTQVNPGDVIDVLFAGDKAPLTGSFKVLTSKVGRGKCGSRVATIESLANPGTILTIGTPHNDQVVNVTHNSVKYGLDSSTEVISYDKRDVTKAADLKAKLKPLVGYGGRQLKIISTAEPEFNGTFTLESAELSKGRYGQVILKMTNDATGQSVKLWSYRHSGVIDSVEVVH